MGGPAFAMNTASGAYKAIIASIFPELNRSISDGITPSGSVGSGKDFDIRDLLFGVVEPRCCDDTHGWAWASAAIDRSAGQNFQIASTYSSDSGAEPQQCSRTNADNRLALDPFGRVK